MYDTFFGRHKAAFQRNMGGSHEVQRASIQAGRRLGIVSRQAGQD